MKRLLVLMAAAIGVWGCNSTPEPPVAHVPSVADSAEQVILQLSTILTNQGVERGTLTADTAFVFHDQTMFDMRTVHVAFRDSIGRPGGTIQADSGRYNMRTAVLEGWGHVVVTTTDGRRLETPQLRYNQAANLISSDTSFVLTTADHKTKRGIGFTTDPNLNTIRILRGSSGSGFIDSLPGR